MAIILEFGVLIDDFGQTKIMKTWALDKATNAVECASGIRVPFRPFAGVMGVAPDTGEMLDTGPPRANGGNLDNPHLVQEVQYETDAYYATTGFAPTLEVAAQKATRYMIDYLVTEKGLSREDAYMLCSLPGDLEIAEAVDTPDMLVVMHLPKSLFANSREAGGRAGALVLFLAERPVSRRRHAPLRSRLIC